MKYATRINSFLRFDSNLLNAFRSIGSIEGVDYVDLNYPEHFADYDIEVIKAKMEECGLRCNAINLRFRDKYIGGEFGNHEPAISQDAITLCREAADEMCIRDSLFPLALFVSSQQPLYRRWGMPRVFTDRCFSPLVWYCLHSL